VFGNSNSLCFGAVAGIKMPPVFESCSEPGGYMTSPRISPRGYLNLAQRRDAKTSGSFPSAVLENPGEQIDGF
jgi:hypothetical protein